MTKQEFINIYQHQASARILRKKESRIADEEERKRN